MPKAKVEQTPVFRGLLAERGLAHLNNPFTDARGEYGLHMLRQQGVFRSLGSVLTDPLPDGPDCRRLRELAGVRLTWLGAALGVPEGVLVSWEAGVRRLSDEMIDDTVGIEGLRVFFAAIRAWAEEHAPTWEADAEAKERAAAEAVAARKIVFDGATTAAAAATAKLGEASASIELAVSAARDAGQHEAAKTLERALFDLDDLANAVSRGRAQLHFQPAA